MTNTEFKYPSNFPPFFQLHGVMIDFLVTTITVVLDVNLYERYVWSSNAVDQFVYEGLE